MKSEYQFNSAQELTPEIIQAIKLAFGDKPIRMTIESALSDNKSQSDKDKFPSDLTDSIINVILDQLAKKK